MAKLWDRVHEYDQCLYVVLEDGEDMDDWWRDRHREDLNIPVPLLWDMVLLCSPPPQRVD